MYADEGHDLGPAAGQPAPGLGVGLDPVTPTSAPPNPVLDSGRLPEPDQAGALPEPDQAGTQHAAAAAAGVAEVAGLPPLPLPLQALGGWNVGDADLGGFGSLSRGSGGRGSGGGRSLLYFGADGDRDVVEELAPLLLQPGQAPPGSVLEGEGGRGGASSSTSTTASTKPAPATAGLGRDVGGGSGVSSRPGRMLPRYRLDTRFAQGHFGEVWRATKPGRGWVGGGEAGHKA